MLELSRIHSTNGEIGHVESFPLDSVDRGTCCPIIDAKNWGPGQYVLTSQVKASRACDPFHDRPAR